MLIDFHEQGCTQYIGWKYRFHFKSGQLSQLKEEQKIMSQQLQLWSEAITAARDKCYVLNSYTMKQILLLRKELHPQFTTTGDMEFVLAPQALSLLKCIHPCAATETILIKLKESWNDLEAKSEMKTLPKKCPSDNDTPESHQLPTKDPRELLDDIVNTFTGNENLIYVNLTERQGHDKLWVMSEILKRSIRTDIKDPRNNCKVKEISLHMSALSSENKKPTDTELMESIKKSLFELGENALIETIAMEPQTIQMPQNMEVNSEEVVSENISVQAYFDDM